MMSTCLHVLAMMTHVLDTCLLAITTEATNVGVNIAWTSGSKETDS